MIKLLKPIILSSLLILCFKSNLIAQDSDTLFLKNAVISFQQKNYPKVRDFAIKALEKNPNNGEAYILIGMAYISSADSCFDRYYYKDIVYCLAVDKFEKAIQVDSSVAEKAKKLIDIFSRYFPSNEDIPFGAPYEGQKYTIGCWINEETIIRNSK